MTGEDFFETERQESSVLKTKEFVFVKDPSFWEITKEEIEKLPKALENLFGVPPRWDDLGLRSAFVTEKGSLCVSNQRIKDDFGDHMVLYRKVGRYDKKNVDNNTESLISEKSRWKRGFVISGIDIPHILLLTQAKESENLDLVYDKIPLMMRYSPADKFSLDNAFFVLEVISKQLKFRKFLVGKEKCFTWREEL